MKAIILAAWKWTRLRPITDSVPKVMVEIANKPLLEYNLEYLAPYVDELIIVVKYKQEVIKQYFWSSFQWIPIRYHEQREVSGTGAALWWIEITGDCFIVTSDQLFNKKDIDILAQSPHYGALAKKVHNPEKYGIFRTSSDWNIIEIMEKPKSYIGNLASLLYFKVNSEVLDDAKNIEISERGEYELLTPINNFWKNHIFTVFPLQYPFLDITSVEDLENANLNILTLEKPKFWSSIFLENIGEYSLHVGIAKSEIESIVIYSQDPSDIALVHNTGDNKRFSSYEKFLWWYNDTGRYTFSLLDPDGNIAWIWYGRPSELPEIAIIENLELANRIQENLDKIHTWGIRIYPNARGKWLATPMIDRCTYYYRLIFPDAYMSIDIDSGNIASQKAYIRSGYIYLWLGENKKTIEKNQKHRRLFIETPF